MAALPFDIDMKDIRAGHKRPGRGVKLAQFSCWRVMNAVDLRDIKTVHDPFVDHNLSAAAAFFGRLKNQGNTT